MNRSSQRPLTQKTLNDLLRVLPSLDKEKQDRAVEQVKWCFIREPIASWDRGPLRWLTRHTKTEDQHWLKKGTPEVAPFPQLEYFLHLMDLMLTQEVLFIWKSRELMTSWLACGYIAWMCQWYPQIMWLMQTEKLDKAKELINYCRILWRRQDPWIKARVPLLVDNQTELQFGNGSRIIAVPQGENQARLFHPYGFLMDEAAFLPDAEQCFNAVRPVAKQIIAVSSDELGWYHSECKDSNEAMA